MRPVKQSRSSKETELAGAAVAALRKLGYECIRVNAGKRPAPGGGWSIGARKGTPDWLVVHPYGWLEMKDLTDLSPAQKQWHAWAKRCGVPVVVVKSVGDAVRFVRELHRDVTHFEPLKIIEPEKKPKKRAA